MLIILAMIRVKPEYVEEFRTATIENARNSSREAGVARYDLVQQTDDPTRFVLIEAYRSAEALEPHGQSAHFQTWLGAVTDMFAETPTATQYANIFPPDSGWGLPVGNFA